MALSNIGFDEISESDLQEQVTAGVPEGVLIDYKRDMYGRADADKREFLKDISSFANSSGGHLIIGIDESGGVPTTIVALTGNPDDDLQRLENLARSGLEPRIVGLRIKSVPVGAGGHVLVLRIPKSWNPPHRVIAQNTNRIYGRNSAGAYEFSVDELRVVFTMAASALDRVRAFRAERLAKIDADEAIAPLQQGGGRLVLHLVPASAFSLGSKIDPEKARAEQQLLHPMGVMGSSPRINFDGFSNIHDNGNGRCTSYTQVFRNGSLEAVLAGILDVSGNRLWLGAIGSYVFGQLSEYLKALQSLDISPPIVLMLTLQGVRGAVPSLQHNLRNASPIDRSVLELPEVIFEQYGDEIDYHRTARPALDALWNTHGVARSNFFNSEGQWQAPP